MLCKWKNIFNLYKWGILAFAFAFAISYGAFYLIWQRYGNIIEIKKYFSIIQHNLNIAGYDIAYEDMEFNTLYPYPLLTAKNFQIYKRSEKDFISWKIKNIEINSGLFSPQTICFDLSATQLLQIKTSEYTITPQQSNICLDFDINGLYNFTYSANNTNIKNISEIQEIKIGARRIMPKSITNTSPFFDIHARINNFKFNGLLKYPLSQTISDIYLNSVIIGSISSNNDFSTSLNQWRENNGYIDIKRLTINWSPLVLVGRGEMHFNKKFSPSIRINSSSKGLLELISQLQENKHIDSKGAFVSKILLENKSFLLQDEDKHSTVITPIDFKDGKISVENITIYNFNKKTAE